ncbi:MAG: hypothetical protein II956_12635 [Bacteroidales bacterium]|nr:hypothetical protein [Bacteroidales bacterium]
MLEEQLKNKTAIRYFKKFDCTDIIKRIDFTVKISNKVNSEYLLWAEAKQSPTDIYQMLSQLIVTIKQDAYNILPPKFIGCFDSEKIAFVEYNAVLPVYALNDFNWSQTPSNVDEKTVETVRKTISRENIFTFYFGKDDDEIHNFIEQNFIEGGSLLSTLIDKNNFIFVYQKWREMVMPSINADWEKLKKLYAIYDRDFFLAELNIDDNDTTDIGDDKVAYPDFYITFDAKSPKPYILTRTDDMGLEYQIPFKFRAGGLEKYADFWKRYKRPPKNVYWRYIIGRLDLLVPQDVRERKGAFYTPQIWVELSQKYLASTFGVNWQDEYYIWDCCAGTGNLLNGLANKYKIFASTLDQQDVDVMRDRIRNGANLLEGHIFQFDFLNDDFFSEKVPEKLREIISDEKLRRKLIIYINPPYSEPSSYGKGSKPQVANLTAIFKRFSGTIGSEAMQELFAQFFVRVVNDLPGSTLATFSTPKFITSQKFDKFRQYFKAKFLKGFACKAETFDNVDGKFPIGFYVLSLDNSSVLKKVALDVYDNDKSLTKYTKIGKKTFSSVIGKSIGEWRKTFYDFDSEPIGYAVIVGPSMQSNNNTFFTSIPPLSYMKKGMVANITDKNIIEFSVYLAIRQCVEATWINDKDNYLYPSDKWRKDYEFQTDCLVFTLFHTQNRITAKDGVNNWIPFTEYEVNAKEEFSSHFMSDFLNGKIKSTTDKTNLFGKKRYDVNLQFSETAQTVLSAGRELWRYYHTMEAANVNASLYDIKEFFQGRDKNGKMKTVSDDAYYTELSATLKSALWDLGEVIKPKVYEYGFLNE